MKYHMIPNKDRHSNCQIEAYVHYRDLVSHPADGEWAKMAPLRILSFDIECAGRKGVFPEANQDPVIQIANVVTRYGEEKHLQFRFPVPLGPCETSESWKIPLLVSTQECNVTGQGHQFLE